MPFGIQVLVKVAHQASAEVEVAIAPTNEAQLQVADHIWCVGDGTMGKHSCPNASKGVHLDRCSGCW